MVTIADILTITFGPCIDKSARVTELIPGKKLRCQDIRTEPGGGGVNVARALYRLGAKATALYPAGGCTGNILQELLRDEHIAQKVVRVAAESRENVIINEESTGSQYRFGMPVPSLNDAECRMLLNVLESMEDMDYIILSGSMDEATANNAIQTISRIADRMGAAFCVDTSGAALQAAVKCSPFMIKPNLGELAQLVGKKWLDIPAALPAARSLLEKYQINNIIVSLGKDGALLVNKNSHWRFTPPDVVPKSTVGAGDSMVAGIIYSLSCQWSIVDAVRFGIACGTAATLNPGTELCRLQDAKDIYTQVKMESSPAVI